MLRKTLVSLAATALMIGSVTPALAREGYTRGKAHKMQEKTSSMTVRRGDMRVKVMRASRRDIKMKTRARWVPKAESSASSAASSSASSDSSASN